MDDNGEKFANLTQSPVDFSVKSTTDSGQNHKATFLLGLKPLYLLRPSLVVQTVTPGVQSLGQKRREGDPLEYACLENSIDGGPGGL